MKKRTFLFFTLIIVVYGCNISVVHAQNKSILALADQYALALRKTRNQKTKQSIEPLLRKGKAVAEKLDEIESLSETDYSLLEKKMKGFSINRDEIVFIVPDSKFFTRLSKARETRTDVAFFTLMREIRPDNLWAAYIEQQTDVTGCTIYGNGLLTNFYGKTLQFKRVHPKAYIKDIDEEIYGIVAEFSDNLCACGDREGVLKEFRLFIKTFPKDKNTPAIEKRLAKIEKEKDFRFNCQSG